MNRSMKLASLLSARTGTSDSFFFSSVLYNLQTLFTRMTGTTEKFHFESPQCFIRKTYLNVRVFVRGAEGILSNALKNWPWNPTASLFYFSRWYFPDRYAEVVFYPNKKRNNQRKCVQAWPGYAAGQEFECEWSVNFLFWRLSRRVGLYSLFKTSSIFSASQLCTAIQVAWSQQISLSNLSASVLMSYSASEGTETALHFSLYAARNIRIRIRSNCYADSADIP